MKEIHEFRIFKDYYHLLPTNKAKFNGMVYVLKIFYDDPLFQQIGILDKELRKKHSKALFGFWDVSRNYTKKEFADANIFHFNIKTAFEPTGEECGTVYDETTACEICGANRKQVNPLKLKKGSIPKKDIARTIAGEIVVSEKFADVFKKRGLKGATLEPVLFEKGTSNYYQLVASSEVELSQNTVAGINPFDLSTGSEGEIYKCPKGHTIGLNLLSEAYALNSQSIGKYDFFASKQKIGVKRGLLRPEPLYLCSQEFRKMVLEEKLKGFDFEIAHIE